MNNNIAVKRVVTTLIRAYYIYVFCYGHYSRLMEITKDSILYPRALLEIKDLPYQLYIKGDIDERSFDNCIAFVGSRNMSPYGSSLIDKFIKELAGFVCTIVSGFTRGVDRYSHLVSIQHKINTVAVLPYGIDDHLLNGDALYKAIISNRGLVISEYQPNFRATKWSFVKRNRIIAGISMATIIIEAAENSGSLITAKITHSYSKPVFVVPGNIFSPLHKGVYQLMKSFAVTVDSGYAVAEYLNLKRRNSDSLENNKSAISLKDGLILNAIRSEPLDSEHLSLVLDCSKTQIISDLLRLQSNNLIYLKGGKYYVKEG